MIMTLGTNIAAWAINTDASLTNTQTNRFQVQGLGFKDYKRLISETLYAIVWIGRFNALGETVL